MSNKIVSFFEHARTIWAVIFVLFSIAVWAADQRYEQKGSIAHAMTIKEIKEIDNYIFDLAVEITPENKIVNNAKIDRYKAKKELLMKEISQ